METRFEKYTALLRLLCDTMSVSGHTREAGEELRPHLAKDFDSYAIDAVGNVILQKKSTRAGAPKLLIDAHLDEVGMMVSDITDDGFLHVVPIGGIDSRILGGADVFVYGREVLRGVVAATPPHLQRPGEADKLRKISDLVVDTGYTKEELRGRVAIGDAVGFASGLRPLAGKALSGRGLDDKCCAASAILALSECARDELAFDVTLVLAAFEETARIGGAAVAVYTAEPDLALSLDVGFASSPDTKDMIDEKLGDGLLVTFSSVTSRKFTKKVVSLCEERKIPYQVTVSAGSLGTDGEVLSISREGNATVDLGVPLRHMHTYTEVISGDDALALADLVAAIATSKDFAKEAAR